MSNFNDFTGYQGLKPSNQFYEKSNKGYGPGNNDVISIGMWVLILIGLGIPIVNIIVMFGLAFGSDNKTLSNFGKASLILVGIGLFLVLLLNGCQGI